MPYLRSSLLVEPAKTLDLPHNPFALALFREDPTEADVIRSSPEREVKEEEQARCRSRKRKEQHKLQSEEGEVEQIDVGLGVSRVEEGEDIMRGWNAENCTGNR